jgi:hypothetical protein
MLNISSCPAHQLIIDRVKMLNHDLQFTRIACQSQNEANNFFFKFGFLKYLLKMTKTISPVFIHKNLFW